MKTILVMSGTREGREIIRLLKDAGYRVIATSVTNYGSAFSEAAGADVVLTGALGHEGLVDLIYKYDVDCIVDATHPFALEASRNAVRACRESGKGYLRFERKPMPLPSSPLVYLSKDFRKAGEIASQLGSNIFYTAGIKNLSTFLGSAQRRNVIVRVVPQPEAIRRCVELGVPVENIIAAQGPFTKELNIAMFREYGADVIVTKESGKEGGADTKVEAALELGIPIVVIKRPKGEYPFVVYEASEVVEWISKNL
jgi:precorrin-6A/cobalt-precorrin-6A reductase